MCTRLVSNYNGTGIVFIGNMLSWLSLYDEVKVLIFQLFLQISQFLFTKRNSSVYFTLKTVALYLKKILQFL